MQVAIDVRSDGSERYVQPEATSCLCAGHYDSDSHNLHVVWLAFVANEPGMVAADGWWFSQAAAIIGRTDIVHCQFVFYDHARRRFYTYSVDKQNGVSCSYTKTFSRGGWRFFRMVLTERQELALRKALIDELDKPFDFWATVWLYWWPRKSNGQRWFCSELMLTAMKKAGLALNAPSPHVTPPHRLFAFMQTQYRDGECILMTHTIDGVTKYANPVVAEDRLVQCASSIFSL